MKRSEQIVLGAAGLILVAALWPASETPEPATDSTTPLAYASASECRAAGIIPIMECDDKWKRAEEQAVAAAPKFEQMSTCETSYGAGSCRPASANGTSFFVPAMVGFLLARQFSGSGAGPAVQPLYPTRPGSAGFAPGTAQRPCPTGANSQSPDCQPAARSGSGTSSGGGSGGTSRSYTTGSGAAVTNYARGSTSPPRTTTSSSSSSSSTVSRGGFGSSSHGYSSGG